MEQIVDKLNKIAKKINENVEIPDSDLIIDSLDAITTALGGTPNDSKLIVDKLEDIAGVATGGGGGQETVTKTYKIMPAGTYQLQLIEGIKYIVWEHEETDELTICSPIAAFSISINNHSFEFHPTQGSISTTYPTPPLYSTGDIIVPDVGRFNYEAYISYESTMIQVPIQVIGDELTEYTVDSDVEVSVTGKAVTTLPSDTENGVLRTHYLAKNNGIYFYYTSNESELIELPMDILVCAECETE